MLENISVKIILLAPGLDGDGGGDGLGVAGLLLDGLAPHLVPRHVRPDGEGEGGDRDEGVVPQHAGPGPGLLLQRGSVPGPGEDGRRSPTFNN